MHGDTLFHVPGVGATVSDVDDQVARCTTALKPQIDATHTALADAKKRATDIKTAWASNKLVPSDSRKHVDSVATALDTFKTAIDHAVAEGLTALKQLRMKLLALNPHQAAAGAESTGPVVRTAPAHSGDVVVPLKPRPAAATAKPQNTPTGPSAPTPK